MMGKTSSRRLVRLALGSSAAAALLAPAMPAGAQETAMAESAASEEIVVTARKRQESLLAVPLTITAVTADKIAAANIITMQDLTRFTPGLHFENAGSRQASVPRIRGLDINTANPTRQNASFLIDGIYFPGTVQAINFGDLERVEVIKGPQSALFGRQTFGGAINFITRTPGAAFEANATANFAEGAFRDFTAGISVPVLGDRLAVRLSGRLFDYEGVFRNSVDGQRLGAQSSRAYSAFVVARPIDGVEVRLRYLGNEDEDGPAAIAQLGIADRNCQPVPGRAQFFCGAIPPRPRFALNSQVAANARGIDRFGFNRNADLMTAQVNIDIGDHVLTASYGRYVDRNADVADLDITGIPRFATQTTQTMRDNNYEIRLVSPDNRRFRYVVGAFLYRGFFEQLGLTSGNFASTAGGNLSLIPATGNSEIARARNVSGFASLSYDLLDRLTLGAELRVQEDEVINTGGAGVNRRTLSGKTTAWLPRFLVNYSVAPDVMLYGVFSRGNKPKQFNANIAGLTQEQRDYIRSQFGVETELKEETLDNIEAGIKARLLDGRATATFAVFQLDWNDQVTRAQVFRSPADLAAQANQINAVANAGSSRIRGFEAEFTARPVDGLVLEGTVARTDAVFKSFNSVNLQEVFGDPETRGRKSARFPAWQGSFGATYTAGLREDLDLVTRFDLFHVGKRFTDEVNLAWAAPYWTSNLRMSVQARNWRVGVFAENLFDEKAVTSASRFRDISVPGNAFSFPYALLLPRRFGATLGFTY